MVDICLDRMKIEEAGPNPVKLAAAIHDQLGNQSGPVPVDLIARALDIDDIRVEPLDNFEGALITTAEREHGLILVNGNSSHQRQRSTIAHELGHFLNVYHLPTAENGFQCSRDDIQNGRWNVAAGSNRYARQEAEANRFMIEFLLPVVRLTTALSRAPDIALILTLAEDNEISREATARRYVECHDATIAIAFSHQGRLRYWAKQDTFPPVAFWNGAQIPDLPNMRKDAKLSDFQDADPADWLAKPDNTELAVQTLYQQNGYAMTLLIVETNAEDDDDGDIEDAFDRFSGFNSGP